MARTDEYSSATGLPHSVTLARLVRTSIRTSNLISCRMLILNRLGRDFVSGLIALFYADGWRGRIDGLNQVMNNR